MTDERKTHAQFHLLLISLSHICNAAFIIGSFIIRFEQTKFQLWFDFSLIFKKLKRC